MFLIIFFSGSDLNDLVTISIKLTRLQYAKMMYQTFHIPKKFYNSMRIVSGADSILLNKSFDIGCRLMCGLESAYQREKNEVALNIKMKTDSKLLNKLNGKYKEFYSTNNDENKSIISSIDCLIE